MVSPNLLRISSMTSAIPAAVCNSWGGASTTGGGSSGTGAGSSAVVDGSAARTWVSGASALGLAVGMSGVELPLLIKARAIAAQITITTPVTAAMTTGPRGSFDGCVANGCTGFVACRSVTNDHSSPSVVA